MGNKFEAVSSSGVATLEGFPNRGVVQVSVRVRTGTGTSTITVKPSGKETFESVEDGTIDMSSPTTLRIEGFINGVKATSSESGDDFDLIVTG